MDDIQVMKILRHKGFTLIELMVAMAVMAVFVTVAVPAFQTLTMNNRLITQNNSLISSLNLARSEAAKRVVTVTVCASANQTSCSGDNRWEKGWILFSDVDAQGDIDVGTDEILQVGNGLQGENSLRTEVFPNAAQIQYNARGNLNSAGTFVVCDSRGNTEAHGINIDITGRVHIALDNDNPPNDIVDNVSGVDVNCP